MALISTLIDTFPGTQLDSKWAVDGTVTVANNSVAVPSLGSYPSFNSVASYTLVGSSIYAKVTPPKANDGGEQMGFLLTDSLSADNTHVQIFVNGAGNISMEVKSAGTVVSTQATTLTAATNPGWWRVRDDGAKKVYFDTSPDGTTWTNRLSYTYTFTMPAVLLNVYSADYTADAPSNPTKVEYLNTTTLPSVGQTPAMGGSDFFLSVPQGPLANSTTVASGLVNSNGHDWVPIVDEDFTSTPNSTNVQADYPNMGYYNAFSDTSGQGWYDPTSVLRVVNGVLTATLRTDTPSAAAGGGSAKPLIACVMPDNYQDTIYGRASVRFRANATTPGSGNQVGYKLVWFYFPNDNNWNEGEIDAFEGDIRAGSRSRPANAIPGTGKGSTGQPADGAGNVYSMTFSPGYDLFMTTDMSTWHIATVEWAPEGIFLYWDGVLIGLLDNSRGNWVPSNPMNFKLQMETVIGEGTVDPTAVATIEIDRVQTWELVGFGAGAFGYNGFGE